MTSLLQQLAQFGYIVCHLTAICDLEYQTGDISESFLKCIMEVGHKTVGKLCNDNLALQRCF